MPRFFFALLLTIGTLTMGFSQPYAHVNFGNLLSQMTEVAAAEAKLQAYEKEQMAIGEGMVKQLAKDYNTAKENAAETTPKALAAIEAKLKKDQVAIQEFEREMSVNIDKKRQELLGPIIQKARDAVTEAAKAGGFQMVFDSSIFGSVLFAEDTTDLMPVVKAKLGIKE